MKKSVFKDYYLHYSGNFPGDFDGQGGSRTLCGYDTDWIDLPTGATSSTGGPRTVGFRSMIPPPCPTASPGPSLGDHSGRNIAGKWIFYRSTQSVDVVYNWYWTGPVLRPIPGSFHWFSGAPSEPSNFDYWYEGFGSLSTGLAVAMGGNSLLLLQYATGSIANVALVRIWTPPQSGPPYRTNVELAYQTATGTMVIE
ncbi:MAG: hypothetical protein FJZ01_16305 [Candidatus Sericytochromatia bacterium]|nr:hypothetical protein [Candidatus Tanganyikabacteria bacterium]